MLKAYYVKNLIEAGIDEAGRGCLAGPVTAAAVILPPKYRNKWLNDSKQLNALQREELKSEIEAKALAFAIGTADHTEIDQINILNASFLAMHRAIDHIITILEPQHLLIDGNRFSPYLGIPHVCIVKGDAKYQSIAAASILAKTHRDAYMTSLSSEHPNYNWSQNMGYPTVEHRKAVKEHGFSPFHRLTFKIS
jgi:ribonuclease HII